MADKVYSYKDVKTIRMFSEDNSFIRGLMGPVGAGKSSGCVIEIANRAKNQMVGADGVRRTKFAVVRNTYPQLRDTTIPTFMEWLGPFGDFKVSTNDFVLNKIHAQDGSQIESIIHFRALDNPKDIRNLLSLELTGAWINEAREIPKEIFDGLRMRVDRYPAKKNGGATWAGLWMDTNPPDADSWWYRLFEEDKPVGKDGVPIARIFKQPSALSPEAENLSNLSETYYPNLIVGQNPDWIKVYIHGEYGYTRDGKAVYNNWSDLTHVAEKILIINKAYPVIVGIDNTGLNQGVVITQPFPTGRFNVIYEFLYPGMGTRRLMAEVVKPWLISNCIGASIQFWGDPAGVSRQDNNERSTFDEILAAGFEAFPARTNAWQPRFESVDSLLTKLIEGKPALQVSPNCKMLRKGFAGEYRFRRLQLGGTERYHERPEKNMVANLHDALQYAALGTEDCLFPRNNRRSQATHDEAPPVAAWS